MKKSKRYILVDKIPVEEPDLAKWEQWYKHADRVVQCTDIPVTNDNRFLFKISSPDCVINVTTIFLGVDHALNDDNPILFETKISGGQYDQRRRWNRTWREAEIEHQFAVEALLQGGFVCWLKKPD